MLASQLLLELPVRSSLIAKTLCQNKKSVTGIYNLGLANSFFFLDKLGLANSDSALNNFS